MMMNQTFNALKWNGLKQGQTLMRQFVKHLPSSSVASDLNGRDLVSLDHYSPNDFHTVLWNALDLKERQTEKKLCPGKSICMISDDPLRRLALSNAATRLGSSVAFVNSSDLPTKTLHVEYLGKALGSAADIIFIDSKNFTQEDCELLANGCTVPVVVVGNADLCPVVCLSELMALQEHYGYLRRLIISYIGVGGDVTLNTYALILPKVGVNLHFLIQGEMNGSCWEKGINLAAKYSKEFQQFENKEACLFRAHSLSTCNHNFEEFNCTVEDTKEMDLDWTLLHGDVSKGSTVPQKMLLSKPSLVWNAIANQTWIFQALVLSKTSGYRPISARPGFEGVP